MRMRTVIASVALLAALPASASAVTFGANLNREPNNTITCGSFDMGLGYPPATFNSCSWDFQQPATGESVFPPVGTGVISRVRVRVGATTGPMQIVVEEALRKDNPSDPGHPTYACCKAINVSQVFTPTPNAVSTIPVNLPVRSDAAPDPASGYYVDDHLALSVLARNVPIPGNNDSGAFDGGWFPAWQKGDERAGAYGTSGVVLLFNADWNATSGAPGTGGSEPPITLGRLRALRDGTGRLGVTVPGPGAVRLVDDRAATRAVNLAASKKARVKAVKRTVKKAGKITLTIKPTKAGKRTLRRKHKLKVKVRISFTPSGAKSSATKTKSLTLKLKPRH